MVTPPLPPEIKLAEKEMGRLLCRYNGGEIDTITMMTETGKQLDIIKTAIWNAAIEKAAEYCNQRRRANEVKSCGYLAGESLDCERGILNLKLKE